MFIEYFNTNEDGLELIRSLWTELNRFHIGRSVYFQHHYEEMTFELRKRQLLKIKRKKGYLRIDLAVDREKNHEVGYCVSSISAEKVGEIESIFVEESYRRRSIGITLATNALAWMDVTGVENKRVSVSYGNEEMWSFYRKLGFYPRMTVLEQIL